MSSLTVQFDGESPYAAIVNHYGLDIVEEQQFNAWLGVHGFANHSSLSLEVLEKLYEIWQTEAGHATR